VKFIHCADLHLDTPFTGLADSRSAEIRQAELRQTFLKTIELAKNADALLIAGDLFDQDSVEPETIRTILKGFADLGDTKVLIAAGNHDPLTEKSYYRLAAFSPNVHIFGTQIEKMTVADCDVYGVSFGSANQTESLLANVTPMGERPSVLLMHGNLGGKDYNPISAEEVCQSGFSYLALGHVHARTEDVLGKTLCAYPGCPEGRGFDELGEKGVLSVEVTEEGTKTEFIPVCKRRHTELNVDITGMVTQEEIIEAIAKQIERKEDLYKVILCGEAELMPRIEVIKEAFSACFFIKVYDRTKRPVDLATLSHEPGLRGLFVQKLLESKDASEEELYRKALEFGLSAMAGEKVRLR